MNDFRWCEVCEQEEEKINPVDFPGDAMSIWVPSQEEHRTETITGMIDTFLRRASGQMRDEEAR